VTAGLVARLQVSGWPANAGMPSWLCTHRRRRGVCVVRYERL
jgi:hypothetical protein